MKHHACYSYQPFLLVVVVKSGRIYEAAIEKMTQKQNKNTILFTLHYQAFKNHPYQWYFIITPIKQVERLIVIY